MNVVDLLESRGVEVRRAGEHHHVSDGWIGADCPSCSPNSGRFRLGISLSGRGANCWSCGRQNVAYMLSILCGLPYKEAQSLVGRVEHVSPVKKARGKLKLPSHMGELGPAHRKYLKGRGYDVDELIEVWGLKGTGPHSSHPWSVVIPVVLAGETLSFTTRQLHDNGVRYVSAKPSEEAVSLKELLLGEDLCGNAVVAVEGPLDAMRVGPGAVATFGLTYTRAQVVRLARFPRRLVAFDKSAKAQAAARRLCAELAVYPGETLRVELEADDPGCASPEEVKELRRWLQ